LFLALLQAQQFLAVADLQDIQLHNNRQYPCMSGLHRQASVMFGLMEIGIGAAEDIRIVMDTGHVHAAIVYGQPAHGCVQAEVIIGRKDIGDNNELSPAVKRDFFIFLIRVLAFAMNQY